MVSNCDDSRSGDRENLHLENAIDLQCFSNDLVFGRTAVAVSPRYTSQKCSNCGAKVKKSLSTRTHICSCGYTAHRDENAAINILNLALQARDGQSRRNALGS